MNKYLIIAVSLLAALTSCQRETAPVAGLRTPELDALVPGTYEVKVSPELAARLGDGSQTKAGDASIALGGVESVERLFNIGGKYEARQRSFGLDRWYRVKVDPATKSGDDLMVLDGVESVEPRHRARLSGLLPFNDEFGGLQWHLKNDGSLCEGFCKGADINVVPVWEKYTGGSSDIIVAVVDVGVSMTHPDLAPVVLPEGEGGSRNFIESKFSPGSHGTHVAGLIGAVNNNGTGVCGVAGGLDGKGGVKIMSCRVFGDADEQEGGFEQAIQWACDNGALICNNSWGLTYPRQEVALESTLPAALKDAIDYFIRFAGCDVNGNQLPGSPMKGGLVLFAAGNENWSIGHPASYDKVVAVGALGPDGKPTRYSNYGDWVDICAPGGHFESFPDVADAGILSTCFMDGEDGYSYNEGTSMACPIVSGVAALLLSSFGGEGFTADRLKELLLDNVNKDFPVDKSKNIGHLVDAYASFFAGKAHRPVPVETGDIFVDCTDTASFAISRFFYDEDGDKLDVTASCEPADVVSVVCDRDSIRFAPLCKGRTVVKLKAVDYDGLDAENTFRLAVRDAEKFADLYPNPVVDVLNVAVAGTDAVEIEILSPSGVLLLAVRADGNYYSPVTFDMKSCAPGVYTAVVRKGTVEQKYSIAKL